MKQKRNFCKRLLTFVLCLAMVLTSVNIPALTVQAAQEPTDGNLSETFDETISDNTTDEMIDVVTEDGEDDFVEGKTESEEAADKPAEPFELVAKYWDADDANQGKIKIYWGGAKNASSWTISIDGKKVGESTDNVYYAENIYDAGKHTVELIAVNDAGESDPVTTTFTLTEEQSGGNKEGIVGSEDGADAGKDTDDDNDDIELYAKNDVLVSPDKDLSGIGVDAVLLNGWSAWTDAGITAQGAANSTVTFTYPAGKTSQDYTLQFQTAINIGVTEGTYYTLSFTAQSSIPRSIEVCMGGSPDEGYPRNNKLDYKLPANQETQVTYVFASEVTGQRKIQFLLGTLADDKSPLWTQEGGHTLKISNVSLTEAGSAETAGVNQSAANKTALNTEIGEADTLNEAEYLEDSWAEFAAALSAAKTVNDNASAKQVEADTALTDLQIAKASLLPTDYVPLPDPVTMVDPINFEEATIETYRSQDADGWGGDSNVQFGYDNTTATITADNFGWNSWAVQWKIQELSSDVEDNVFEFDVVSSIDKNIIYKNENTQATETIELKAGELKHIARRVTGKNFNVTFDLNGGGGGTLTFTNMRFGEELTCYNFEEAEANGNLELYVGRDWANASATGEANGTEYTINAAQFGGVNEWGIQLMLHNFIQVKKTAVYKIHATIESSVDKDITVKLGNPAEENDVLAIANVSLKANEPKEVVLDSELWSEELASTLYFACGNASGGGTIKVSNLWMVVNKPGIKDAPQLTTDRVNDKKNGYRIGDNVVLKFPETAAGWAEKITAVKVNNATVEVTKSAENHTITIGKDVFKDYNVYKIVIEADAYRNAEIAVPVYDSSVDSEDWEIQWADEFNGTELDPEMWDYEIGVKSGDDTNSSAPIYWGNNEKQYYTKEAVEVKDGKLVITANPLTDELKSKYNITDTEVKYSSARIRTVSEDGSDTLFSTTYGRIEAAMELPYATGYWPAFWMLPTNETIDIYGTWATSGELDIMEAGQTPNTVDGTIHYGSVWPGNVYSGGHYTFPEEGATGNSHVYAVEWEPGEIRWYADDILYHVENNWYAKGEGASSNYAYPAPFDEDFYILFNLAVGGNYIGNVEPTELNQSMKVDYVRVKTDNKKDYGTTPEAPDVEKDSEFFEANKQYADEAGNYLKDAPFETLADHKMGDGATVVPGLGYWSSATNTGLGAATDIAVVEKDGVKYAKIDVTKTGANNYDVQLIQHVPLAKGYTYKLTFDAYTDVAGGRNFSVAPKGDGDNGWAGYDSGIAPNLTTTVQSFEHIFTMAKDSDPTARIEMNIGNALGTVYVGNAKLVALTDQEVADLEKEKLNGKKTPLGNGEHIYNGGFDQGTNKFAYWIVQGDYSVDTSNRTMKATINSSTDSIDDVILSEPGIQLLQGDSYKLTLQAKADAPKDIKVGLYSKDGTVYAEKTYQLTTDMTKFALEFTMPKGTTDEEAVLKIAFGGNMTSVELDNISMMRTSNRNADWNESLLYPLGGETWSDYTYFVYENNTSKTVPADGIITEALKPSTNNYDYMIYREASVKTGYTYDLSFDIKTSVPNQTIVASVQQDGTWTTLTEETVTTTTDWQTVKKTFKATTEGAVNLKFLISASTNTDCNVSLQNVTLNVVGGPYLVSGLHNDAREMLVNDTYQLNVEHAVDVKDEYKSYTYKSSDVNKVTVDDSGLITAKAEGDAVITVVSGAGATKKIKISVVSSLTAGDTTELQECIDQYKEDDYTTASWAEFKDALEAAQKEANKSDLTQNDVDEALVALKAAAAKLVKVGDKTALNASIEKYENTETYKEADYTAETWTRFAKALEAAKGVAGTRDAVQEDVDDALAELEKAAKALVKLGDKTALLASIAEYEGYTNDGYTAETWSRFEKALEAAQTVAEKDEVTKPEIQRVLQNLRAAAAALEKLGDKKELNEIIAKYETYKEADYTAETWAKFAKALKAAKAVAENEDASQAEVDSAKMVLEAAAAALVKAGGSDTPETADKSALTAILTKYANVEGDEADANYQAFKAAYDKAKALVTDNTATQTDIDDAVKAVKNTYLAYVRALLETDVNEYEGMEQNAYTDDTWNVFTDALEKAQKLLADDSEKDAEAAAERFVKAREDLQAAHRGLFEKDDLWVKNIPAQTYTGSAIKPAVEVWEGNQRLTEKKDYTVSYKKNTNAGQAEVIIKGKGNYKDNATVYFTILPKDIAELDVADVYAIIKNGKVSANPKVTVKYGKKTVTLGDTNKKDCKVTYPEIPTVTTDDGKTSVVPGNYPITIEARNVKDVGEDGNETVTYTGNYAGKKTINYAVLSSDTRLMSKATITLSVEGTKVKSVNYAGMNGADTVRPDVTVTFGSGDNKITLTKDVDYTLEYVGWDKVGKATVEVKAITKDPALGDENTKYYYGMKTATYTVKGKAFKASNITIDGFMGTGYTYTGDAIMLAENELVLKDKNCKDDNGELYTLVKGTDYQISYSNNTNAGKKASIIFEGMGSYAGSKITKNFTIDPLSLDTYKNEGSELVWSCPEKAVYTKTGAVPAYTLIFRGEPLTVKTDYTVSYSGNKTVKENESSATIKINGKGNFTGELTAQYEVTKLTTEEINAGAVYAEAADIVVPNKLNNLKASLKVYEKSTGKALKAGTDYDKNFTYYVEDAETGEEVEVTADDLVPDKKIIVSVTLKSNYSGTGEEPATIKTSFRLYNSKQKASGFQVVVDDNEGQGWFYTGQQIKPNVTVYKNKASKNANEAPLVEGEDYKVDYTNNIQKGTAKIMITGLGNGYGGTKTVTFKIKNKTMFFRDWGQSIADFFSNLF